MPLADAMESLRIENDMLRARVHDLEKILCSEAPAPTCLGLTRSEECVLNVLLAREAATKEAIYTALYPCGGDRQPEPKVMDVFICKLRRKLRRFGVRITTRWGQGWRMSPQDKAKVRALVEEEGR